MIPAVLGWLYANVLGNLIASILWATPLFLWHHHHIRNLMWCDHRETRQEFADVIGGQHKHTRDELGQLADTVTREHARTRQLLDPDPQTREHQWQPSPTSKSSTPNSSRRSTATSTTSTSPGTTSSPRPSRNSEPSSPPGSSPSSPSSPTPSEAAWSLTDRPLASPRTIPPPAAPPGSHRRGL